MRAYEQQLKRTFFTWRIEKQLKLICNFMYVKHIVTMYFAKEKEQKIYENSRSLYLTIRALRGTLVENHVTKFYFSNF